MGHECEGNLHKSLMDVSGSNFSCLRPPCLQSLSLCSSLSSSLSSLCLRLFLKSHSGTAGRQSSLAIHGTDFSTKDMDNDNCTCKCALMLSGGKAEILCFSSLLLNVLIYSSRTSLFLFLGYTSLDPQDDTAIACRIKAFKYITTGEVEHILFLNDMQLVQ